MLETIYIIIAMMIVVTIVVLYIISNISLFASLAERMREKLCEMSEENSSVHINLKQGRIREGSVCVYVSGAISGLDPAHVKRCFAQGALYASAWIQVREDGARVINPAMLEAQHDVSTWTQAQFMVHWKTVIYTQVSHMVMLPGWEDSKGARMEHDWAVELGLAIHYMPVSGMYMPLDEPMYEHTDDSSPLWSMLYTEDDFGSHEDDQWDSLYIKDAPPIKGDHGPAHNRRTDRIKAAAHAPTV
tara:strand:- start:519 stop:1253 length:735 start_codon:yes stop_codon:yes gene_type:complete